ncbi:MAG: ATP synthase subunit delta [Candidatus Poribacteria bacterium]|nr:MAG: ATP synthase subunit delta [Candidatus Poribacteria bacterium]
MRYQRIARGYAKALVLAAEDLNAQESVREAATGLLELIRSVEPFREMIETTDLTPSVKEELFQRSVGEALPPLMISFFRLLLEKRRERLLGAILQEVLRLADQRAGIETAQVTSVIPLTEEQTERLQRRLAAAYSARAVRLEKRYDPEILGGLIVRIRDTIYDASLRAQLERLRRTLIEG